MKLFIGTTFYSSLILTKAPGTVSSLLIYLLLVIFPLGLWVKIALLVLLAALHFICFPFFEKRYGLPDPPSYTLDEAFAVLLLSLSFHSGYELLAAFLIFRFFDILKPLGIKAFEEWRFLSSAIRNIGDDIIAAVYTYLSIIGFQYAFEKDFYLLFVSFYLH